MTLIFLTLFISAIANLLTKEVATITGVAFTRFLQRLLVSDHVHHGGKEAAPTTTSISNNSIRSTPKSSA